MLKQMLFFLLVPVSVWACLGWDPPTEDFEGNPLTAPIEEYIVFVGSTNVFSEMNEVMRTNVPDTVTVTCQALGYTPHKWACVKARHVQGISECSDMLKHLPPGKVKNVKVR